VVDDTVTSTIFTPPPAEASPPTDPLYFTASDSEATTSTGDSSQTSDIPQATVSTGVDPPSSDDNGLNTGTIIRIAVSGGILVADPYLHCCGISGL
jgi:hypothetical protein